MKSKTINGNDLKLENVHGVDIINKYNSKKLDPFSHAVMNTFNGPIKYKYYELIDDNDNVVHVITCEKEAMVQSIAARWGYHYRCVEFEERFEDLDKE